MNGGNSRQDSRASQAARWGLHSPLAGPRPLPITPRAATVFRDSSYDPFSCPNQGSSVLQVRDHNSTCLKAARPPEKQPPSLTVPPSSAPPTSKTTTTNLPIGDHQRANSVDTPLLPA